MRRRFACGLHEAENTQTVVVIFLEVAGEALRTLADADDKDITQDSEFTPDDGHQIACPHPPCDDENPAERDEQTEKGTARLQLQREHKYDQRQARIGSLPERIPENDADASGIQLAVHVAPETNRKPREAGKAEQQGFYMDGNGEFEIETQPKTDLISDREGERGEKDVRQSK